MIDFSADDVRIFLHLLGVTVWVGGQIVLGALVPVLRRAGADVPRAAARRFGLVAWPFFTLAVITGIWNIAEVSVGDTTSGYQAVLGIKLLAVAASGGAAFVHSATNSVPVRAATGGLALLGAIVALFLGVLMT